jgi:hypothetical protein
LEKILAIEPIAIKKHGTGYTVINMEPDISYLSRGKTLISALTVALEKLQGESK